MDGLLSALRPRVGCTRHPCSSEHPGGKDSISNKRKHGSLEEAHVFLAVSFRGNLSLESLEGTLRDRWALPARVAHTYWLPPKGPAFNFLSLPSVASPTLGAVELMLLGDEPQEVWVWSWDIPQVAFSSLDWVFLLLLIAKSLMLHPWVASV